MSPALTRRATKGAPRNAPTSCSTMPATMYTCIQSKHRRDITPYPKSESSAMWCGTNFHPYSC
eukprot:734848-Pyramimonas_sp.AAC.1